jgi:hypothetical protein
MESSASVWENLGEVPPPSLVDARLTLHWAAQIVAAAGATWLERRPDDSHAAMTWLGSLRALAGEPLAGVRAALLFEDLRLAVIGPDDRLLDAYPLANRTLADGLRWLANALARVHHAKERELVRPGHDMPDHSVATGGRFANPAPAALRELARWYANADRLLADVARTPGASPLRCWPHHFDIATLITLDTTLSSEHARSIGVGLSPGDSSYGEPYWYVTPWPYPERGQGRLPVGHWHTRGWFGAVLTAAELLNAEPAAQEMRARAFVDAATKEYRRLLASSG